MIMPSRSQLRSQRQWLTISPTHRPAWVSGGGYYTCTLVESQRSVSPFLLLRCGVTEDILVEIEWGPLTIPLMAGQRLRECAQARINCPHLRISHF